MTDFGKSLRWKRKKIREGYCTQCGKNPSPVYWRCAECRMKQKLNAAKRFMLTCFLTLGCSGAEFKGVSNEKGFDSSAAGESSGGSEGLGGSSVSAGSPAQTTPGAGMAGTGGHVGGMGGSTPTAGSGGANAMAGGLPVGEGGSGGDSAPDPHAPRQCLAFFQNLDCARVCTNSASDCQGVLNCFVQNDSNSLDNCMNFTSMGISLAQSAERNCCNVE